MTTAIKLLKQTQRLVIQALLHEQLRNPQLLDTTVLYK